MSHQERWGSGARCGARSGWGRGRGGDRTGRADPPGVGRRCGRTTTPSSAGSITGGPQRRRSPQRCWRSPARIWSRLAACCCWHGAGRWSWAARGCGCTLTSRTSPASTSPARPAARGHRLGSRLLFAVEDEARARGLHVLRLDTRSDLIEARRLHTRHGYEEVEPFNADPYAQHWFTKQLTDPASATPT